MPAGIPAAGAPSRRTPSSRPPASSTAGQAVVALISWLTHAGQSYAATLGYVPLPPAIQQLAASTLTRVTGTAREPLTG